MNDEYITVKKSEYEELKKNSIEMASFIRENQILHSENTIAAQIQRSMLPGEKLLVDDDYLSIYADMDSAKEVGGDFYDYLFLDDDTLFFCIGDVSGKGVPAIIHMVACRVLFRNRISSLHEKGDLAALFFDINKELYQMTKKKQFITCFSGIYDMRTGNLRYVNAGHTKTIIYDGNEIKKLEKVSGLPLGAYYNENKQEKCVYKEYEITVKPETLLFLYTDGCVEAMNNSGDTFGLNRVEDIILSRGKKVSISQLITYIQRNIISFENHEVQDDDCTIMAITIKGYKE